VEVRGEVVFIVDARNYELKPVNMTQKPVLRVEVGALGALERKT
jgi:hypothetical protein